MALNYKNFSTSIEPKTLTYSDEYISLKGDYITTNNNIDFIVYDAFKDVNDVKSNNFSNLILTKKQRNSDILELTGINNDDYPDFVTTLSFFSYDPSDIKNPGIWMAIDKGFDTYETDTTKSSFKLVEGTPENYNNYLWRVECINDKDCIISHTFGDATYYLIYDNGFTTSLNPEKGHFKYLISNGMLRLYSMDVNMLAQVVCKKINNVWCLTLQTDEVADENAIIFINDDEEKLTHFINSSWITYNRENVINRVNPIKSKMDLESQFLIHHEYSDEDNNVNLIPLKNNLTYQGTVTNGSNLVASNNGKRIISPIVDYRNYTTINSGTNQERGSENITLTFTFTDQVYHLEEGDECIFTLPATGEETIYGPLYPYETININDTAFVRNGAFGSNVPYFADKFRKLQNHTSKSNNYTYLCTWLYQPDESSTPIWLDRYYYPDYVDRKNLYNKTVSEDGSTFLGSYGLSFQNNLDLFYLNDKFINANEDITPYEKELLEDFEDAIKKRGYIDKKSDLTIHGGTIYKYSRLSKAMVDEVYNNLADKRIEYVKDEHSNDVLLNLPFSFNSEQWRKIAADNFNGTHAINFNTNIYINPKKKMGIQLFGCDYKYGFNIQNRKDLTPFSYYASEEIVYMFNNRFEACNQFNVKEKYNTDIKYLVVSAPFNDLYLFTKDSMFILDYDLRLKNEIALDTILNNGDVKSSYKEEIYSTHIIIHNKNLYAVVNNKNDILKIIINPETEAEKKLLENKFIASRILGKGEYSTNFNAVHNATLSQTAPIIKSLYSNDDKIYAFNYDILKMSHDGDNIYGIIKEKSEYFNNWYYIFNQSISKLHIDAAASKYPEFTSDISIDSIAYGPRGYFGLVRGFDTNEDKNKVLEIYDKSKTKIYNYPLSGYDKLISLDYYRYIDNSFEEHDAIIALLSLNDFLTVVEYQIDTERIVVHTSNIKAEKTCPTFRNIIDSNAFINKLEENKLYFNLNLSESETPLVYEWDLTTAQEGWYNINVEIDYNEAIFNIKINDILVSSFNSDGNQNFIKHPHLNVSIFDSTYYYGVIGKKYGTTLNEILNGNHVYDPYAIRNSKSENTTLYSKVLSFFEYQATRLHFSNINPLVLTLPCGIRNGIEEIIRYFKFAKPGSTSNKVKINISGLDNIILEKETESLKKPMIEKEMELLKKSIIDSLSNNDYLINVKEIEFI